MRQTKNWFFILASLKKKVDMLRIFLAIFLIAGAFGGPAVADEFVDYGTQYQFKPPFADFLGQEPISLHICAGGSFMTGVHVKYNWFLCEDGKGWFGSTYRPSELTANEMPGRKERYSSHGMAACPPGKAMVGLHADRNVLLCAPLKMTDLFIDADTQRDKMPVMHACPKGSVMVGIHDAHNLLLCGRLP